MIDEILAIRARIEQQCSYSSAKKDKYGEVFTPFSLIEEMLDSLPSDVWRDPTKTFFDPAAGRGNFPIAVIERLFRNQKDASLKHIVEEQIFMAELQAESCAFIRDAFSFGRGYKVNLYEGNSLEIPDDYWDVWGMKFKK